MQIVNKLKLILKICLKKNPYNNTNTQKISMVSVFYAKSYNLVKLY